MPRTAISKPRVVTRFIGGSTLFNGSSSYLTLPFTPSLSGFSILLRVKILPGFLNGSVLFDWESAADRNGFSLKFDTSSMLIVCVGSTASAPDSILVSTTKIQYGVWYDIAFTYQPNRHRLYVNSVLESLDTSIVVTTNATTPTLGKRSYGAVGYGKFFMADFLYASAELTQTEIAGYFYNGRLPISAADYYTLSDQPPTYIDSISGNNGTGIATTYSTDTPVQQRVVVSDDKASLSFPGNKVIAKVLPGNTSTITPNATDNFSCGAWVKLKEKTVVGDNDPHTILCANFDYGNNLGYEFQISGSTGLFIFYIGNSEVVSTIKYFKYNEWQHVVYTMSGPTGKVYLNGKPVWETAITRKGAGNGPLTCFGQENETIDAFARRLKGLMRGMFATKTLLSDEDVKNIYFDNSYPTVGIKYTTNEGAGTIAYDSSGNGNNGTITGATWSSDTPSKKRSIVGGNLVKNGDFSYVPVGTVATNTFGKFINGTAAGDTVNIFGWALLEKDVDGSSLFTETGVLKVSNISTNANASAGITPSNSAANIVQYGIMLTPGVSYTLSGRVKTSLTSGAATTGARLFANIYNATGSYQTTKFAVSSITTTTDWTTYSTTFTPSTSQLIAIVYLNVKGNDGAATLIMDAWFADITLTKTTPEKRTVV